MMRMLISAMMPIDSEDVREASKSGHFPLSVSSRAISIANAGALAGVRRLTSTSERLEEEASLGSAV